MFCAKNRCKKHQIFEKWDDFENRPSYKGYSPCKGYGLCKMVSLGQKLKMDFEIWRPNWPFCLTTAFAKRSFVTFKNLVRFRMLGFFEPFYAYNNSNVVVKSLLIFFNGFGTLKSSIRLVISLMVKIWLLHANKAPICFVFLTFWPFKCGLFNSRRVLKDKCLRRFERWVTKGWNFRD